MKHGLLSRARTTLLAGIGLTLAACAVEPAPYGYYGSSTYPAYYGYGAPTYGSLDFFYGGGFYGGRRFHRPHPGFHRGHFVHGGRPGFAHHGGHGFHGHGHGGHPR